MSVKDVEFLASAFTSFKLDSEIGYRNAISRAYYSTYHKSLERVTKMPKAKGSHHAALIKYLESQECIKNERYPAEILKELARSMRQLRGMRNRADYNLDTVITQGIAADHLMLARRIYALWGDLLEHFDNHEAEALS
ncbi:hypothetical protein [Serratia marcescens]|uniref:hypothetical protein n=1 Tax=Serratia marcescens TaxID=615 RepID=UPI003966FF2E